MAVEQISEWRVSALPVVPVVGRRYNKKGGADPGFRPFITNSAGVAVPLDAPTIAELTNGLALKQDKLVAGPAGSYFADDLTWKLLNKATVGLGNVDNTSDANKPVSTAQAAALLLKANDDAVVKLTGNQNNIAGIKTFLSSPVVPNATTAAQAVAYGQMTSADAAIQLQIDNLVAAISGGMKSPLDLDASANPNYPAAVKGDNYMITVPGRIGGASGPEVEVGDWAINKANSAAGNHATVGANWFIVQRNVGIATEAIIGMLRKATQAEAEAGTSDAGAMTPLKTAQFSDKRNVRFDVATSLTAPQQAQARANIGASSAANISGTINRIAMFTTAGVVGDSIIREDTGKIGIGKAPVVALDVLGAINATENIVAGSSASPNARSFKIENSSDWLRFFIGGGGAPLDATSPGIMTTNNGTAPYNGYGKTILMGLASDNATNGKIEFRVGSARSLAFTIEPTGVLTMTNRIVSTLTTGTAPFTVASTTLVPNLNVEFLGGKRANEFASITDMQWNSGGDPEW